MWVVKDRINDLLVCSKYLSECKKYVLNKIKSNNDKICKKEYWYDEDNNITTVSYSTFNCRFFIIEFVRNLDGVEL